MTFGFRDQAIGDFGKVLDLLLLHMGQTATEHNVHSQAVQKRLDNTRGELDLHELVFVRCVSFESQLQDGLEVFVVCLVQLLVPGLQRGRLALRAFQAGKLRFDNAIVDRGCLRTRR